VFQAEDGGTDEDDLDDELMPVQGATLEDEVALGLDQ
jgi:hypothetical protein